MKLTSTIERTPFPTHNMEERKSEQTTTVFVTGGSGFLGRNLIKYLRQKQWNVKALARSNESADIVKQLGGWLHTK